MNDLKPPQVSLVTTRVAAGRPTIAIRGLDSQSGVDPYSAILGYGHQLSNYVGSKPEPEVAKDYKTPRNLSQNDWALSGHWRLGREHTTAVRDAKLALHFHAKDVYLVMGGRGRVGVSVDGHELQTIAVKGINRLYTVLSEPVLLDAQLRLSVTPGVSVYSFTFG